MIREPGGEFTQHGKQSRPSKEKGMIINNKCHRKASTVKQMHCAYPMDVTVVICQTTFCEWGKQSPTMGEHSATV